MASGSGNGEYSSTDASGHSLVSIHTKTVNESYTTQYPPTLTTTTRYVLAGTPGGISNNWLDGSGRTALVQDEGGGMTSYTYETGTLAGSPATFTVGAGSYSRQMVSEGVIGGSNGEVLANQSLRHVTIIEPAGNVVV